MCSQTDTIYKSDENYGENYTSFVALLVQKSEKWGEERGPQSRGRGWDGDGAHSADRRGAYS